MFEARFQSFDDPEPAQTGPRVEALRAELARRGLTGFILPRADRHQNEYVPRCEERLAWLTGFTGSAGTTVVLEDRAALFVDGRYTIQAGMQVDGAVFAIVNVGETPPDKWLAQNLQPARSSATTRGCTPWTARRSSRAPAPTRAQP